MSTARECPYCHYLSPADYCGRCGSLTHMDHWRAERDREWEGWARGLEEMLNE